MTGTGGRREGAGRKPLSQATKLASFDIDTEEWRLFQEVCKEEGVTCAQSLRSYIATKIDAKRVRK